MLDWKKVYESSFFSADGCWKQCNSYCCSNFHADRMAMLSSRGVILPFFPGEFEHYRNIPGVEIEAENVSVQEYRFPDGNVFRLHFVSCFCGGTCSPHQARPLICRIYPYYPRVDYSGRITGFGYSALMDTLYAEPQESHPCWLVRCQGERIRSELGEALEEIVRVPEMIFAFKAMEIIERRLRAHMPEKLDFAADEAEVARFFKRLEMAILTRKPWSGQEAVGEFVDVYETLKRKHGDLCLT